VRSLDCLSVFALSCSEAQQVLDAIAGPDAEDPYSRSGNPVQFSPQQFKFAVPSHLEFHGDSGYAKLFAQAILKLRQIGGTPVEIDFAPFVEAARLLYGGPWVAERYLAIREFFERRPEALFPVTREIVAGAAQYSAADAFAAEYRLQEIRRTVEPVWQAIDLLVTPTAGTIYAIAEVNADPIRLNTNLGYYTNFMNLLDLAAIAVPAGFQANGLPFGVTLAAPAFTDEGLCRLGGALQRELMQTMGATKAPVPAAAKRAPSVPGIVRLAVCGAHMAGLPLNHQLTERGARLVRTCRTAPRYRLYALAGFTPARPGMVRADADGQPIEVEVWAVPAETVGSFVDGIPPPLGIGTVELEDGEQVRGFVCEGYAVAGARDISALGSWRKFAG
jgi:allophanate hydrolase